MAYGKDDELAINTIRLLAVSPTPDITMSSRAAVYCYSAAPLLVSITPLSKLIFCSLLRSMPPSKPTPAIPEPPWAWHRFLMFYLINS